MGLGFGFGNAMGRLDGFGILSLASICTIIAVLRTSICVQGKIQRRHKLAEKSLNRVELGVATPRVNVKSPSSPTSP